MGEHPMGKWKEGEARNLWDERAGGRARVKIWGALEFGPPRQRWFAELIQTAVCRGAFRSVAELELAIEEFMQA